MPPSKFPPLQDLKLFSIQQINRLPGEHALQIYRDLISPAVCSRFGIDESLTDSEGRPLFDCQMTATSVEFILRHVWDAEDPIFYLQLADTPHNQIEITQFVINDPTSERFDVDRLPDGTPTYFGTVARNIPEEIKAMRYGLAPGQVRRGLRMTRSLLPILEQFVAALQHDSYFIQPLAYHNAIIFERFGFGYVTGRGRMEWIQREFSLWGVLTRRLDGSTPFRHIGMASHVVGRSWAIHDGILGEPFTNVKMYKRVGIHAGVVTFPDAPWRIT